MSVAPPNSRVNSNQSLTYLQSDVYDPRTRLFRAYQGTLFIYLGPGAPLLLQKLDNDPDSLNWVVVGGLGPTPGSGDEFDVDYFTLNSAQVLAQAVVLSKVPTAPAKVLLCPIGGAPQLYASDYIVSGSLLSWADLGFATLAAVGDVLQVVYPSTPSE